MSTTHLHDHDSGTHQSLTIDDRHAHEAEVYDEMARELLATLTDDELRADPDRIPFPNREHNDYLTFGLKQLGQLKGARILEVGVGGGALAAYLATQGADVTGVDVSSGILELAAKRAEVSGVSDRVRLVHSPIESFDDAEGFDAIIGNNVLHHFELQEALPQIGSLLKPGAPAVFCEPVLFVPESLRSVRYSKVVSRYFPPHTHTPDERSLDKQTLQAIGHHFADVNWTPFHVTCRLQHFVELSDRTWNRLERFDRSLLKRVPASRHICRQIVLTLRRPLPHHTPFSNHNPLPRSTQLPTDGGLT